MKVALCSALAVTSCGQSSPGPETAIRVGASTHRKIHPGPEGARILALGGVPGAAYSPPAFTELGGPEPVADPARIA